MKTEHDREVAKLTRSSILYFRISGYHSGSIFRSGFGIIGLRRPNKGLKLRESILVLEAAWRPVSLTLPAD